MSSATKERTSKDLMLLALCACFTPLRKPPVVEWAERELYLSRRFTERAGAFSTADCAYMREPLECFKDFDVQEVDLMFATQTGKTTLEQVGLAYSIECNPRRAMWAFPTDDLARRFVKKRWNILVNDAEAVARHKSDDRDEMTNFDQSFDTCNVMFNGVGSAAKVSSEPIALLIEDEIDKFPSATDKESDARSLLEERTKSFVYKLIVRSSTPTTRDGNIMRSFEKSDQRYYYVRCPHCHEMIKFDFKNLRWYQKEDSGEEWDVSRVRDTARYYCQKCGAGITDLQRRKMIRGGQWVSENPAAPRRHRGYHLNAFYAPTLSLADIAQKFIECKEDPQELQNFINSWLAEPWEEATYDSDPAKLLSCVKEYDKGDIKGDVRVMTIDVQRRDLRFNVRGYDKSGSYLIDWGTLTGFDGVEHYQSKYDVFYVGIDINYRDREQEVYDAIYKNRNNNWVAIVGAGDRAQKNPFAISKFNPFVGKKRQSKLATNNILLLTIRTSIYKGEIARRRSGTKSNWHVYRHIERGYTRELFAEIQTEKFERGRRVKTWKVIREDNHQFDLECYQLALADAYKLHTHGALQFTSVAKTEIKPRKRDNAKPAETEDSGDKITIKRRKLINESNR